MINRRHIRIKVMQALYALQKSDSTDLVREEKLLKHSIYKMFDLYALSLQLIIEVQKLAAKKLELYKKKHLPTKEDLNPNRKFVRNLLLQKLTKNESLQLHLQAQKLNNWTIDNEYVRIIFDELQTSAVFKRYMNTVEFSFKVDKSFSIDFFKEIIAPNEKLADYYEDDTISWTDDIPFINTWVVRTLSKQKKDEIFMLGSLYKDKDDEDFVIDLFRKTALNSKKYEEDIIGKTPNWEIDRIADIDMILIKMAICEFLNFPSIPNRVTINEYIEIAKDYSTYKSSYFINGILDKLSKEFIQNKRSVKVGRGLL